jgi:hypothetical protein
MRQYDGNAVSEPVVILSAPRFHLASLLSTSLERLQLIIGQQTPCQAEYIVSTRNIPLATISAVSFDLALLHLTKVFGNLKPTWTVCVGLGTPS